MWLALRLKKMNVAYISGDCRGVTQSSLLHVSLWPVDGATALSKHALSWADYKNRYKSRAGR